MFAEISTEGILAIVGVVTLLITSVATYFKAKQAIEQTKEAVKQTGEAVKQTEAYHEGVKEYHNEVNSKMDMLLKLVREEGFRQGEQAQKDAQAVKETVEAAITDEAIKDAKRTANEP